MLKTGAEGVLKGATVEDRLTGVGVLIGGTVLEGFPQSKPTLWMLMEQSECSELSGSLKVTDLAPPHWVLEMVEPEAEHDAVCLQVEPSPML